MAPLALLDRELDLDLQTAGEPAEISWYFRAEHTLGDRPCPTAAYLHDLIDYVDHRTGWPWIGLGVVLHGEKSSVYGQLFGDRMRLSIELGGTAPDRMLRAARPGGSRKAARIGGADWLNVEERDILTVADAHIVLDAYLVQLRIPAEAYEFVPYDFLLGTSTAQPGEQRRK